MVRKNLEIHITDVDLSRPFGHIGGWAQRMIARHRASLHAEIPAHRGRPKVVQADSEAWLIQFCLFRQSQKSPVTIQDAIDFLNENGVQVDRFGVWRFVDRNSEVFTFQQAISLEKDRHDVSSDDLKRYFEAMMVHLRTVPSIFVWNADETRVGAAKKQTRPEVIVDARTQAGTVTIAQERDDSQLTMLTAISAFGDSLPPMFITKNKTFEEAKLAAEQLYHPHDYVIREASKTFITEVLFIDWLETQFIPRNENLRATSNYSGPLIVLVDGHASHVTPRVVAFAGSRHIIIIKLVAHSSHISQPLDLCVFGVFKMLNKREQKSKGMKGETLKICRALLVFHKATRIPMVKWSFVRAGFPLNAQDLLAPLTVTLDEVLNRIVSPEMRLEDLVFPQASGRPGRGGQASRRRTRMPWSERAACVVILRWNTNQKKGKSMRSGNCEDSG
jgi:hypothetical protein